MKKLELAEQARFIRWCWDMGFIASATAQSTYTNNWGAINENIKAGVRKGVPDLIIIIPACYREDNNNKVVFIEMKRVKGGVTSKEQKKWITALNTSIGVSASVCHGELKAKEYIKQFLQVEQIHDMLPIEEQDWFKNQ